MTNTELDFEKLNIKISPIIKTLPIEKQKEIYQYLEELDETQKKAYKIAYDHLGSSFNISRSNGFIQWLEKKNKK